MIPAWCEGGYIILEPIELIWGLSLALVSMLSVVRWREA